MPGERYVILGLASARSPWFRAVGQWATAASIAVEFVKCLSAEEVRARLASGRPHSALLVDGQLPAFDRDLVATALQARTPVIAVSDGRAAWSAADLGVAAVLSPDFSREQLLEVLEMHAAQIRRGDALPPAASEDERAVWRGRLIAVCGPGGTGASTIAIALAQGLAEDVRYGGRVLLADLALRADQAMLHDSPDVGPGLQELVEAHRLGRPSADEVRRMAFHVPRRRYRLLLGLRRPAAWSVLRPRSVDAALDGLGQAFQVVVADVTGDVEGEADGGSIDVEERNQLARAAVTAADAVFAVGCPGLKGAHSLGWLVRSLIGVGVSDDRLITVVNRAPRHPRSRAEITRALSVACGDIGASAGPVFVPERKVDELLRDGSALPAALVQPLIGAVGAVLERQAHGPPPLPTAMAVQPGSIGRFTSEDDFGP